PSTNPATEEATTTSAVPFGPGIDAITVETLAATAPRAPADGRVRGPGTSNPTRGEAAAANPDEPSGQIGPTGAPTGPFDRGASAKRAGSGHGAARQPEPLPSLATVELAGQAVRSGTRDVIVLGDPCSGATLGRLDPTAGPIVDLDADPSTFTLDLDGVEVGSRKLALDCPDEAVTDFDLLVYSQTSSPPIGPGAVAILTLVGLLAVGAVLGPTAQTGAAPSRHRDGRPPHWFPPD
ncbi:MAG: hypothetical protein ACR2QO_22635, partial [Acidimicrobiales bacterium]